jgi:multidrug efflux system outer membrane protein
MKLRISSPFFLSSLSLLLSGCMVGPDYERPQANVPKGWISSPVSATQSLDSLQWWRSFEDPELIQLIQTAVTANQDIQVAIQQIEQYRLLLGLSESMFLPSVGATASGLKTKLPKGAPTTTATNIKLSDFKAGLNVAYEIDFWGGLRRGKEQALAQLTGKEAAHRTVLITVVSNVAKSYLTLLSTSTKLRLTRQIAANTRRQSDLMEAQYRKGQVSLLDWERTRAHASAADKQVALLEQLYSQKTQALSLLLGGAPQQFYFSKDVQTLKRPALEGVLLPSALLRRRPDVLEAEQNLVALNAAIGIQTASVLPSFNLTSFLGFQSPKLGSLMVPGTSTWQYGAVMTLPPFQGLSIFQAIEASKAAKKAGEHRYLKCVYTALHEVEDALTAYVKTGQQSEASQESSGALTSACALSEHRHQAGYTALSDLKTSEIQRDHAQMDAVDLHTQSLISAIDLYKTLGGGWPPPPSPSHSKPKLSNCPPDPKS